MGLPAIQWRERFQYLILNETWNWLKASKYGIIDNDLYFSSRVTNFTFKKKNLYKLLYATNELSDQSIVQNAEMTAKFLKNQCAETKNSVFFGVFTAGTSIAARTITIENDKYDMNILFNQFSDIQNEPDFKSRYETIRDLLKSDESKRSLIEGVISIASTRFSTNNKSINEYLLSEKRKFNNVIDLNKNQSDNNINIEEEITPEMAARIQALELKLVDANNKIKQYRNYVKRSEFERLLTYNKTVFVLVDIYKKFIDEIKNKPTAFVSVAIENVNRKTEAQIKIINGN